MTGCSCPCGRMQKEQSPSKAAAFARCNWPILAVVAPAFMVLANWWANVLPMASEDNSMEVWKLGIIFALLCIVAVWLVFNEWWYEWRDVGVLPE